MMKRMIRRAAVVALLLAMVASVAMAATYSTLEYGDRGDAVKKMQQALNTLGYSTNGADGKFGPGTENAVRLFQKANGLKQDGKAGNQTLTLLYQLVEGGSAQENKGESSSGSTGGSSASTGSVSSNLFGGNYATLEYGSRGDRVKALQTALNQLGYSAGNADGKFGAGTKRAVVAFQQANRLEADGKAGRITLTKIESLLAGGTSTGGTGGTSTGDSTSGSTGSTSGSTGGSSGSTGGYTVPTRTLRKGYTGEDVKSVQTRLKELGYYTGSIDGKYGSGTMAAVKAFQTTSGLKADGLAGTQTYKKLFATDAASSGGQVEKDEETKPEVKPETNPSGYVIPTRILRKDDTGDDVLSVQKRLKELGYYTGIQDGHYGSGTMAAVLAFQEKHGLKADGLAGTQTCDILFSDKAQKASSGNSADTSDNKQPAADQPTASAPSGGWTTLRRNDTGAAVKQLQEALALLKYPVGVSSANPVEFDYATVWAVECFQRRNGLKADGVAGSDTLSKLYGGQAVGADTTLSTTVAKGVAPGGADLELLHWYNDIKSYLTSNRTFTVYEPDSGLSWKMRLYSAGHHADSEPLTKADSDTMYKVWGNQWTWNEKPVYVQLANGTWCIASMPNMPHLSGGISDNGFDGHTCVHFPRTMTEVQKNDPKNAGRHNRDIRLHWRELTGEDIPW